MSSSLLNVWESENNIKWWHNQKKKQEVKTEWIIKCISSTLTSAVPLQRFCIWLSFFSELFMCILVSRYVFPVYSHAVWPIYLTQEYIMNHHKISYVYFYKIYRQSQNGLVSVCGYQLCAYKRTELPYSGMEAQLFKCWPRCYVILQDSFSHHSLNGSHHPPE